MIYRNELKHVIDAGDKAAICANLRVVAKLDPHAQKKGFYLIRSLYFDNLFDKALREKIDGVNEREKFHIRYYDLDPSVIHLERPPFIYADILRELGFIAGVTKLRKICIFMVYSC